MSIGSLMSKPVKICLEGTAEQNTFYPGGRGRVSKAWEAHIGKVHSTGTTLANLKENLAEDVSRFLAIDLEPQVAISPGGTVFVLFFLGGVWGYGLVEPRKTRIRLLTTMGDDKEEARRAMARHAEDYD